MTNFGYPSAPPPPPEEQRRIYGGTEFPQVLGAVSVWNTLPAVLAGLSLAQSVELGITDLTFAAVIGTFLGALILWLITKRTPRTMLWLVLVALPIYIVSFLLATGVFGLY